MLKALLVLFFAGLFVSCATYQKPVPQKSNLTYATVKKHLIKGQTTQAEVLKLLGNPNVITKEKGFELWSYSRQSFDTDTSSSTGVGLVGGFLGLFGVGGAGAQNTAFSKSSSSSFDLMLKFDKGDVLVDYNVTVSKF